MSFNKFLLKFNLIENGDPYEFTVFPDGRAIIKGTSDAGQGADAVREVRRALTRDGGSSRAGGMLAAEVTHAGNRADRRAGTNSSNGTLAAGRVSTDPIGVLSSGDSGPNLVTGTDCRNEATGGHAWAAVLQ